MKEKKSKQLTTRIIIGMLLGLIVGFVCHALAPNPDAAKTIADYFSIVTDVFLRLIKMIIAPLVFSTLVSGIASMQDGTAVGRIGAKALIWFTVASLISLSLGILFVNTFQVGSSLHLSLPDLSSPAEAGPQIETSVLSLKNFIPHMFPTSFFEAMGRNEILQILVFALFFGFALSSLKDGTADTVTKFINETVQIMLKCTDYVMCITPLVVFASLASVITVQGFGVLSTYGQLVGTFFLALATLGFLMMAIGYIFLKGSIFTLIKTIKEPMVIAFSTASSEAAYTKMMQQLKHFGVDPRITGLVLPLGYSFNLCGSMIYESFAVLFIAHAYHIHITIPQQIIMLLVLMISSKGTASVARGSLVVIAATLPMFHLPQAGLLLILGVDQFLDMGRSLINIIGNGIAVSVVAKLENQLVFPETESVPTLPEATAASNGL